MGRSNPGQFMERQRDNFSGVDPQTLLSYSLTTNCFRILQTNRLVSRKIHLSPDKYNCLQTNKLVSRQINLSPEKYTCLQKNKLVSRQINLSQDKYTCIQTNYKRQTVILQREQRDRQTKTVTICLVCTV